MLKWFAKYNKIMLVVFGVLLMVSFTVGSMSLDSFFNRMFNLVRYQSFEDPGETIGTFGDQTISSVDEREAYFDMQILSVILSRQNAMLPQLVVGEGELRWALLLAESRQAGLWASDSQVMTMLQQLGIQDRASMQQLYERVNVPEDRVYEAVRHYLMIDQLQQLVDGASLTPGVTGGGLSPAAERIKMLSDASQQLMLAYQIGRQASNPQSLMYVRQMSLEARRTILAANGAPRASTPALEHMVSDHASEVAGRFVLVNSQMFLDKVGQPSEEQLQKLFKQYRDNLPGQGSPFPFGYKSPARLRIEALTIPIAPIREQVRPDAEVDLVAVRSYYDQNKGTMQKRDQFGNPTGEVMSFDEARPRIINRLVDQRANEKALQIAKELRARLTANLAEVPQEMGYYKLAADFVPVSMRITADQLSQEQGVPVLPVGIAGEWIAVRNLAQTKKLGLSVIAAAPQVPFVQYARSAREMKPEPNDPLITRRLQLNIPSEIMLDPDGSYCIFRIVAAEPEASPRSLDAVRDQVVANAKQVAAYEMLKQQSSQWVDRARQEGLDKLADQQESQVIPFPSLSRLGGQIPGLGQNTQFIDGVFEFADKLDTPGKLDALPAEARVGGAALDHELSLAIFELTDFMPVSRDIMLSTLGQPLGVVYASMMITGQLPDAMTLESTIKRTGFTYVPGREPKVKDDPNYAPDAQDAQDSQSE